MRKIITISILFVLSWTLYGENQSSHQRDTSKRNVIFAFRSNLLVPLMNVGLEVPIGKYVSLGADYYCPWAMRQWLNYFFPSQKYCTQGQGVYADLRIWFGKKRTAERKLCGHSIGIVGLMGRYDFAWNDSANPPWYGKQGYLWGCGLSYMYALSLGKKSWGRMEFEIAGGYCVCDYTPYTVYQVGGLLYSDGYRVRTQGIFPLRAGINLVVPIYCKIKSYETKH